MASALVSRAFRITFARSSPVASRTTSRNLSLLAAIDQGTSSSRVILYDIASPSPNPLASHQVELQSATTNPQAGWSQMDPVKILSTISTSAAGALKKAGAKPATSSESALQTSGVQSCRTR